MKNFEVGDRVQFIYASKLRTGRINSFSSENGELYAHIEFDGGQVCVKVTADNIAKLDQPEPQSEKVKKINEIMLELIHRKDMDILSDDDITRMLIEALDIVNTLDEPKPVVVPKFVADWLEEHKESPDLVENYTEKDALANTIHFTIYCLFADFPNTNPDVELRKPVCEWLEEDRSNYFKLIDAVRNGFVVEEEKKYYVRVPLFKEDEDASELVPRDKYLTINARSGESYLLSHRIALAGARSDSDWKSQLTEEQIKSEDERYWAFAVPVEEVEASE